MNQEDRMFVLMLLACVGSLAAYATHTTLGPEAALVPAGVGGALALIVHYKLLPIKVYQAAFLVSLVEILGSWLILYMLFAAPLFF